MNASLSKLATVRGAVVLGFGLFGVSASPALACDYESYTGSICVMASSYCPEGTVAVNGSRTISQNYNQALYSILGTLWGSQSGMIVLPNMQGRTAVGINYSYSTGYNSLYSQIPPGQSRGTYTRALSSAQLPPHTHQATFNVTMPPNSVNMTMQANNGTGTSSKISGTTGYLSGGVGITPWTSTLSNPVTVAGTNAAISGGFTSGSVVNQPTGTGATFQATQPTVGLTVCIVTDGVYPVRP